MLTINSFPLPRMVSQCILGCMLIVGSCVFLAAPAVGSTDQMMRVVISSLQSGNYSDALAKLHELDEAILKPEDLDKLWSNAYLGHGYQLLAAGKFAAARRQFQAGREYSKADSRLWQGEAMAWFKEGRFAEVSYLLDQAISYDPQNADLYYFLGQSAYAQGHMPEALDALRRSLELQENQEVRTFFQKVDNDWQVEQSMHQDARGSFKLSFVDGEDSASLASELLAVLEDAYAELGSALDYYPELTIPVLLYTREEYSALTGSPDWSGALYDGKIRLPLAGVAEVDKRLVALLYHEYMHVIVHYMADHQAPVWLNEGLAEVAGRTIHAHDSGAYAGHVSRGDLIDWRTLSKPFTGLEKEKVMLAYEQSHSIVNFMVSNYGWHKMAELLKEHGRSRQWPQSVSNVYGEFGMDWPAIQKEWQAFVIQE